MASRNPPRSILHDPTIYPSPDTFNPSRFLTSSGSLNPNVREPDAAFGFGRRACPGRYVTYDSIWIAVASILTVFRILPAVDSDGNEVPVSGEYTSGALRSVC
jgi:cytochrome P450